LNPDVGEAFDKERGVKGAFVEVAEARTTRVRMRRKR
jgi:hypothetical protein